MFPARGARIAKAALFALGAAALAAGACGNSRDIVVPPPPPSPAPRAVAAPGPPGRLPALARPTRYDIRLEVDPEDDRFSGAVTIALEVLRETETIVLHARDLTVVSAEARQGGAEIGASASAGGVPGVEDALTLRLARPLRPGPATLRLAYGAALVEGLRGLYRVREGGQAYAFTQFQPMDARRAFPCFDEPGFKVPFTVEVSTPKQNLALSNMPEVSRARARDGRWISVRFAETPPLPTYLVALAVGPLEITEGPKEPLPVRLVATPGNAELSALGLEAAGELTKILGAYMGRPLPYPKLDLVAVPDFAGGAMENPGLVTFREEYLLLDPKRASARSKLYLAETMAHELTHQYFGNLVTMRWWDDLWLSEAFATWMEARAVDAYRPELEAGLESLAAKGWALGIDALASARAVRQPVRTASDAEEAFDALTYVKGASVLGMLEGWIGAEPFRAGLRDYLAANEHGSASAEELFSALSRASGKEVWPVARGFFERPGVPLVSARLRCDGRPEVELEQSRYALRTADAAAPLPAEELWKVPVCVAFEGGKEPACLLLEGARALLPLEAKTCPKWIYPNAGEAGYYRFALGSEALSALAAAAGSGASGLGPRERLGLVGGAWALAQSGHLGADVALDIFARVARGKSGRQRLVLDQIVSGLFSASESAVPPEARPAFRAYVTKLLLPIAKELGWERRAKDSESDAMLRRSLLEALALLADDPWVRAEAEKRAGASLAPGGRPLDPEIAAVALRASMVEADLPRLEALRRALSEARTPGERVALTLALGAGGKPEVQRAGLDLLLGDEVRAQDAYRVFGAAVARVETRDAAFAWLAERMPELEKKLPASILARFAGQLSKLCTSPAREKLEPTFREAFARIEGGERAARQGLEAAALCAAMREREGARVAAWLSAR